MCEEPVPPSPYDDCGWDYVDNVTGKALNTTMVNAARAEEMGFVRGMTVWEPVDRPKDVRVYGTR